MPPKESQEKSEQERKAPKTGIAFVHGIGTQPPRETFLDWATPIVRVLSELRRELDEKAPGPNPVGEDPVAKAVNESDDRIWAEVAIPASADRPAGTWLMTESYWATQVRAPGLGETLGYLRRRVGRVIRGIADGYGFREPRRKARIQKIIDDQSKPWPLSRYPLVWDLSGGRRWAWIDWLDRVWQYQPVRFGLGFLAATATIVALTLYAPLRAFPLKAVRDWAEVAALDVWLVDWFGDLPVLLDEPIQAAFVRAKLEATIAWLTEQHCDEIVIVAHSGGAIVSYETLLKMEAQPSERFPIRKLVTHGQGLALGWRLELVQGPMAAGNALRGDLGAAHPKLRWVDFWASYDPAPAGPLMTVEGCPLVSVPAWPQPLPEGSPIQIESRPITNYMHLADDHGGYWSNDEGFVLPLIRHIDDPSGDGSESRFYQDPIVRTVRVERRRRRVGILLGWRWLAFAVGLIAILATALSPRGLAAAGTDLAATSAVLPVVGEIGGAIDRVGKLIQAAFGLIGQEEWAAGIGALGPTVLGGLILVLATFLIYSRGKKTWRVADEQERQKIRREEIGDPGEAWARSEAGLLVGGLIALAAAAILLAVGLPFGASLSIVVWMLIVTAIAGLVLRGS